MIATTGWNAINSISGAAVLHAVSDGRFPIWAGVIVICVAVWVICVLGITWIHRLNTFIWIPPLIVWCVAAGTGASQLTGEDHSRLQGSDKAAAILTFMALIFSFSVSWVNCAADYNVRMPKDTPRWQIFGATYVGISVPTVLVQTLGAALYTGTITNTAWKEAYTASSIGGLLKMALEPAGGFGKFLMVLAALSSIPVSERICQLALVRQLGLIHQLVIFKIRMLTFGDRITSQTITPLHYTHKIWDNGLFAFPVLSWSHLDLSRR